MQPDVRQKFDEICRYPFFESVGEPLPRSVRSVKGWPPAIRECTSRKWENCRLMAGNCLWRMVEEKSWERGQAWGPTADVLRPLIVSFVETVAPRMSLAPNQTKRVKDNFAWDIMYICLESFCRDLVPPIFYLPFLDSWYSVGHFPCGWDGSEFPDGWNGTIGSGRVMVF